MDLQIDLSKVPQAAGVYLLEDFNGNAAYVGMSSRLRARIEQHFIRRDSSITTGAAAASLNPDRIHTIKWWLEERFTNREWLEAAELVAFEVFEPTLRSLGGVSEKARTISEEPGFKDEVRSILSRAPDGEFLPLNLKNLHARVLALESEIRKLRGSCQSAADLLSGDPSEAAE